MTEICRAIPDRVPGNYAIRAAGILLFAGAFLFYAHPAHAALTLAVDTHSIAFGTITKSDLDLGFKEQAASDQAYALRLEITDTGSTNWILKTKVDTALFSALNGNKPCSDLGWRVIGNGLYNAYFTSDATVATGAGNEVVDLDFKLSLSWQDTPDTYSITVVFTLAEDI